MTAGSSGKVGGILVQKFEAFEAPQVRHRSCRSYILQFSGLYSPEHDIRQLVHSNSPYVRWRIGQTIALIELGCLSYCRLVGLPLLMKILRDTHAHGLSVRDFTISTVLHCN